MGREYEGIHRVTYMINADGIIYKVYPKVKPRASNPKSQASSLKPPAKVKPAAISYGVHGGPVRFRTGTIVNHNRRALPHGPP